MYPKTDIKVKIKLNSSSLIVGNININGFDRVSNYVNGIHGEFIPIYNAIMDGKDKSILLVNKRHIEYIKVDF